jgi:hypothetical protein
MNILKFARGRRALAVAALLAPALVAVAPAAPAAAYPQLCRPYEKWATVSNVHYYRTPTHVEGKSMAPYTSWSRTKSIGVDRVYSAGIDLTAEASTQAGVILAKAEVTVGAKLSVAGSYTTRSSITDYWAINNNSGVQRRYVLWSGVMRYTGNYSYSVCAASGRTYSTTTGTWRSHRVRWDGTALCGYPYAKGSMEYNAVRIGAC